MGWVVGSKPMGHRRLEVERLQMDTEENKGMWLVWALIRHVSGDIIGLLCIFLSCHLEAWGCTAWVVGFDA